MRESNFHFPATNKASVSITSALYDRRALDCTADLPLVNSLSHLNYLTSSSSRIRDILTTDGGLERLVRILRTTRVTEDTLHNWKWTMAFQCVVNVGVRGTAEIRQRVVQVGAVPILVEILHAYLLGTEVVRLEQKVREALNAQSERMPLAKLMDFAAEPATHDHDDVGDPSNMVVSSHILASGAGNSTGAAPSHMQSPSAAAARNSAHAAAAAAAAAVAAVTGINPIPVSAAAIPPSASRQQTRRVGEGAHPLARHVAYPDAQNPPTSVPAPTVAAPSQLLPYSNHAYMFSEQERLQAEYEAVRRRYQAISHVMHRHDDVVLTLQLLAYLSKTPSQRQMLHECPLLASRPNAAGPGALAKEVAFTPGTPGNSDLDDAAQAASYAAQANREAKLPPVRRRQCPTPSVDIFSIVEKFTVQKAFPTEMVYWSAIVMRNSCRRDESRNNCRQCAYLKCQKWEHHPNEFAKCRRCRKAKYCSKQCQSSAWQEGHRNWCTERNPSGTANSMSMDVGAAVSNGAVDPTQAVLTPQDPQDPQQQQQQQQQQQPPHYPNQAQQHYNYSQQQLAAATYMPDPSAPAGNAMPAQGAQQLAPATQTQYPATQTQYPADPAAASAAAAAAVTVRGMSSRPKTLRDRTTEYRSLVTALRKRQQSPPEANANGQRQQPVSLGEFSRHAGAIGKDIQGTALLLEQLATLARGKTIFDDKTTEMNTLTNQVKQRIAAINGKILSLQQLQRRLPGGRGGPQASEHHTNVVISLQSQLANASTTFKDVLELRSESLKEAGSRKEQFMGTAAAATAGNMAFSSAGVRNRRRHDGHAATSVDSPLYQTERRTPVPDKTGYAGAVGDNEDFVALSLPDADEASSSQMLLTQPNQSYLDSRSDAIHSIESTISELGSIFQQLAHMVSEQRDVVQRIDANVDSVDTNISAAQTELLKYYSNISSNRWLIVKIFAVILTFVFLLVTFV
ncbi:hypothetical protein GGF46_000462 [Coemansia sp. RSA 552]|nr:hypothetical protein GGF46_000462 [Coemansia sp. RSA 552]